MSFSNLKKQSSLGSLTAKLVSQVEKMNKGSNGVDDRLWKPEVDKAGNGYDARGRGQNRREKPSHTMERIRRMRRDAEKLMRDTSGT